MNNNNNIRSGYTPFASQYRNSLDNAANNQQQNLFNSFGQNGFRNSFGQQYQPLNQRPSSFNSFGSSFNVGPSFQQNRGFQSYRLSQPWFGNRPISMNRPISVYGNNSGFYFPRTNYTGTTTFNRTNDTITFNQNQSPLIPPKEEQDLVNVQQVDQEYQEEQVVEQTEAQIDYQFIYDTLTSLSESSNIDDAKGAVIVDYYGNIIGQGFSYQDEEGNAYEAEQYAIDQAIEAQYDPYTSILFTNNVIPHFLSEYIIQSGLQKVYVMSENKKQSKKMKKNKEMKKTTAALEEVGIDFKIVELE